MSWALYFGVLEFVVCFRRKNHFRGMVYQEGGKGTKSQSYLLCIDAISDCKLDCHFVEFGDANFFVSFELIGICRKEEISRINGEGGRRWGIEGAKI